MSVTRVTVLMSVYNGEQWLDCSIRSILEQTFTDFELLMVNDGSSDRSLAIMEEWASRDERVVIVDKPNTGLADSLNCGIAHAKGAWIARQDADDVSEPDRLRKQWQAAHGMRGVVLVGSGFVLIDEVGKVGRKYKLPRNHGRLKRWLVSGNRFFPHSSAFFNRDIVQRIGGYRPRIRRAQDRDLWLRLLEVGKVICIDEPLVKIRKHANQISHDEGGRRQLVCSNMASASYWLRRAGLPDPIDGDEQTFLYFQRRAVANLDEMKVFEMEEGMTHIRRELGWARSSSGHAFFKIGLFLKIFRGRVTLVRRVIWRRVFGNGFGKSLAREYVKQSALETHTNG